MVELVRRAVDSGSPADSETPDLHGAYPRLSAGQIATLAEHGRTRATERGEVLYREGDTHCDFYVVLDGTVAIVEGHGGDERTICVHGPGRFLGELSLLVGQAVFATAVVREPGEVLEVPVDRLREIVVRDPTLGDVILGACLVRRSILIQLGAGFRIVGSRYSPDTRRLRDFAARNRLPYTWIDLERDPGSEALLRRLGVTADETPVVIWRGEQVMRNPTNDELARAMGLRTRPPPEEVNDLVVVGAGPAGLAAAVYAASDGLRTVALDAVATGGQAGMSPQIENYLGFPSGISGAELAERAAVQAKRFGAEIGVPAEAAALEPGDGHHVVRLADGAAVRARTVVIATGAHYRRLRVPRLEEFEGTSVYYAATRAEAQVCHEDPVAVVGGGNSAGQAATFLARHAAHVRLVIRGGDLGARMSRYLADRIERDPRVDVLCHTEVSELLGYRTLEAVAVVDNRTGERRIVAARALFVFIGAEPHARWLGEGVRLDDRGFVLTGPAPGPAPGAVPGAAPTSDGRWSSPLETSRPGVFAVGDVRSGSVKRVASAVGEGAMAVRLVHERLERQVI